MKKTRIFTALCLTAAMSLTSLGSVFAQSNSSVTFNGSEVIFSDATPIVETENVAVPFYAFTDIVGITDVQYDAQTKMVSAMYNGSKLSFEIGSENVYLDDSMFKVATPAAIISDRTYVGTDFFEKLDGKLSTTDMSTRSITFVTPTYDIMNKYLEYTNAFNENSYAITGDLTLDIETSTDADFKNNINFTGTISGITSASSLNMDIATKADLSAFAEMLGENNQEFLTALENATINYIFNVDDGKFYIKSNALSFLGVDADAWVLIDYNALLGATGSNLDFAGIKQMAKETDFNAYMDKIQAIKMDNVSSQEVTYPLIRLFADQSFAMTDDSTYRSHYLLPTGEDATSEITFILKVDGDKVVGNNMSISSSMLEAGSLKLSMDLDADYNTKATFTFTLPEMFKVDMDMNMKYTQTTETPITAPAEGSVIVDIFENLNMEAQADTEIQ